MKRINRPAAVRTETLECLQTSCPQCGGPTDQQYTKRRTIVTLEGLIQLRLKVRLCQTATCARYHKAYRPEAEGRYGLPQHEFGLDIIAQIGAWRYHEHHSVPEMHAALGPGAVPISERTVTNLLDRYDELVALAVLDVERLRRLTSVHGRVILALDGLQPDVGHEVLWVLRDCLSGEVLLTRSLLSATEADLAALLEEVRDALEVPITAVVSDGQQSIRKAVARALPNIPHQLCHFHYFREAATPVFAADRHAKNELKKHVRGIRPIERALEERDDAAATLVRGYAVAVRSALSDDGLAPLDAAGLRLHQRLRKIVQSVQRVEEKGADQPNSPRSSSGLSAAWQKPLDCASQFAGPTSGSLRPPRYLPIPSSSQRARCAKHSCGCCARLQ
jgi:Transposase, Mutator family